MTSECRTKRQRRPGNDRRIPRHCAIPCVTSRGWSLLLLLLLLLMASLAALASPPREASFEFPSAVKRHLSSYGSPTSRERARTAVTEGVPGCPCLRNPRSWRTAQAEPPVGPVVAVRLALGELQQTWMMPVDDRGAGAPGEGRRGLYIRHCGLTAETSALWLLYPGRKRRCSSGWASSKTCACHRSLPLLRCKLS
eukprot:scaffold421_cov382-Prasinococcus_capsulatus_cf.AAC.7